MTLLGHPSPVTFIVPPFSPAGSVHAEGISLVVKSAAISLAAIVLLAGLPGCAPATPTGPPPQSFGTSVFAVAAAKHPNEAIDVVFAPDDDYGDMNDVANRQAFLDDVDGMIQLGFANNQAWSLNAPVVNYWYMTLSGDVQPGAGSCPSVSWPNLSDATFAEVIILLHTNPLRDCAWGNRVTSEPTSYRTVVHEASHAVFGLPDEYCCDGGYWHAPPVMYNAENSCLTDGSNAAWQDCQALTSSDGDEWWRSEDGNCDIMNCGSVHVLEYGPADWAVVEGVLSALPNATISAPSVFAPAEWP